MPLLHILVRVIFEVGCNICKGKSEWWYLVVQSTIICLEYPVVLVNTQEG